MTQASNGEPVLIPIERPFLTELSYHEAFKIQDLKYVFRLKNLFNGCKPTPSCMAKKLFTCIPFIEWIPTYSVRKELLRDVFSGITVGVIQIAPGEFI